MTAEEMEAIAGGESTKAAKVRALNAAGVSTTEISNFLKIRYQHTYNVLQRAGRIRSGSDLAPPTAGPILSFEVRPDGSAVLPQDVLEALDLRRGGQLFVQQVNEGLLLLPRAVALAQLQRLAAERMPEHAALLSALLMERSSESSSVDDDQPLQDVK
jgi:antitoxin component of MazEF toxin-antitoxin module